MLQGTSRLFLTALAALFMLSAPVYAQDDPAMDPEMEEVDDEMMPENGQDDDPDDDIAKFQDPERLLAILTADEDHELTVLQAAFDAGDLTEEEFNAAALAIEDEKAATAEALDQLSDDQILALNRALNNAEASGLLVNIDAEHLQLILDEDYDRRQIMAITTGLEKEARALDKAGDFEARAEATGNDKFLEQAERFRTRAEVEKTKFFTKATRFDRDEMTDDGLDDDALDDDIQDAVLTTARETARDAAQENARDNAKNQAKFAAQSAAKDAAKEAANQTAREHASESARFK